MVVLMLFSGSTWVHEHLYEVPSQPGSSPGQQYLAPVWQPSGFASMPPVTFPIAATIPTGHLTSSLSQGRDSVLAIFLIQQ